MNKYKTVRVTWADHWIDYGDHDEETVADAVKEPYIGEYTGYLVGESKRMIALASNVWEDGSMSDVMYIMKKSIINNEGLDDV